MAMYAEGDAERTLRERVAATTIVLSSTVSVLSASKISYRRYILCTALFEGIDSVQNDLKGLMKASSSSSYIEVPHQPTSISNPLPCLHLCTGFVRVTSR